MTEKQQKAYDRLLEIDRKITMIGHIEAVLGYDFETVMSKMGGDERSRQMAFLSSMLDSPYLPTQTHSVLFPIDLFFP